MDKKIKLELRDVVTILMALWLVGLTWVYAFPQGSPTTTFGNVIATNNISATNNLSVGGMATVGNLTTGFIKYAAGNTTTNTTCIITKSPAGSGVLEVCDT